MIVFPARPASGEELVLDAFGRLVVAGFLSTASGSTTDDIALARVLADGSLDPTFGTGGMTVTDLGGNERASEVTIQTDGKIVVGGQQTARNDANFLLARYAG